MPYLEDGTVIESHFNLEPVKSALKTQVSEHDLQLGQVIAAYPIDDKRNISKRAVEYDVLVFEARVTLAMYRNCRVADSFGNNVNFSEVAIQPTTNLSVDQAYKTRASLRSGAMVLLACISGHKNQAVIMGVVRHPSWHGDISTSKAPEFKGAGNSGTRDADMKKLPTLLPGAKKEDGERILGEFNGFRWNINKDGEFTVMCQGVKDANGALTNHNAGSILKLDKTGKVTIIDRLDQHITLSPADNTITIADGQHDQDSIILFRADQSIRMTANGKGVVLQAGKGPVKVGSDASNEPLVLGNQLVTLMQQLLQVLQTLPAGLADVGTVPSTPIVSNPAYVAALAAVQGQLQIILSKKAFTELGP